MKYTLILFAFLLVAVAHHCYAEEEDDDMKELANFQDAVIESEEEAKDRLPVNQEDEEEVEKMLNNKAVRKFCYIILYYLL